MGDKIYQVFDFVMNGLKYAIIIFLLFSIPYSCSNQADKSRQEALEAEKQEAYEEGYNVGYDEGFSDGEITYEDNNREKIYIEGYKDGYKNGYDSASEGIEYNDEY
jgi:flagellar biosynthesis/type III secretory pathway protein FliH